MDILTGDEGELTKLKISVCEDTNPFKPKTGEDFVYEALINPEEIKKSFRIVYNKTQANGTTGADLKFVKQIPGSLNLELLFDGTGVLANDRTFGSNILGAAEVESVTKQIERFKKVVYDFDSKKHAPNFLQIQWGDYIFNGKLSNISITYNLFKPDGKPLRAKASCEFIASINDDLRVAKERKNSPDLTHVRIIKDGDTLPLMAHKIYGDSSYYLEIARVNRLINFRNLKAGEKIFFPPIKKSTNE